MSKTKVLYINKTDSDGEVEIVYDAEKALQHKQDMDKAIAYFDAWKKKEDKKHFVAKCFLFIAFSVAMILLTDFGNELRLGVVRLLVLALALSFPVGFIFWRWDEEEDARKPKTEYTPDIKYYLATEGKQVLDIKVTPFLKYFNVNVATAEIDSTITETELTFEVVKRVGLNRIILNVNEGVIYAPYNL